MPASIQWCQGLVKNGPPEIGPSCDNNKPTVAATGIEKFKKAESIPVLQTVPWALRHSNVKSANSFIERSGWIRDWFFLGYRILILDPQFAVYLILKIFFRDHGGKKYSHFIHEYLMSHCYYNVKALEIKGEKKIF